MLKASVKRKNHQFIGAVGLKSPDSVAQFLTMSEMKKVTFSTRKWDNCSYFRIKRMSQTFNCISKHYKQLHYVFISSLRFFL